MYNAMERVFDKALHGYERSLAWVMGHRPLSLVFSVLDSRGNRRALHRSFRRDCSRRTTRASSRPRPRPRREHRTQEMVRLQTLAMKALAARHEHRRLHVERGQLESGESEHRAQARGAAPAGGRDGARAHAPAVGHSGAAGVHPESAEHSHWRARLEEPLPVHAAGARPHARSTRARSSSRRSCARRRRSPT